MKNTNYHNLINSNINKTKTTNTKHYSNKCIKNQRKIRKKIN